MCSSEQNREQDQVPFKVTESVEKDFTFIAFMSDEWQGRVLIITGIIFLAWLSVSVSTGGVWRFGTQVMAFCI